MAAKLKLIWQLMEGERLCYGAAIASLALASGCLYLVPFVSTLVIDGVLGNPTEASTIVRTVVDWSGGRDFLRAHLWLSAAAIVGFTLLAGVFTHLRGRWAGIASEGNARRVRDRLYD